MHHSDDLAELLRPPMRQVDAASCELPQLLNPSTPPLPLGFVREDADGEDARAA